MENKPKRRSQSLWEEAQKYIPGGVNSPVRAFGAVGGNPIFIDRAYGSKLRDVDGNEYIDYVLSWGPLILGHAHPQVVRAVQRAMERGTSFGAPTEGEIALAEMIVEAFPSIELVRLVNSGTEAAMSAIRLARGFTGRDEIVKFDGCYHGHADSLLVKAGSGGETFGIPNSLGVPADLARHTIALPFNDIEAVRGVVEREYKSIACVIVEPILGNMGVIPPREGFLEGLRELTARYDIVLIFDEVITGFRVAYGGAQELYNIEADLTCLGKIIGGGFPIGAYGGRREIMGCVAPTGGVYQAGTLSGNPVAVTAGIETLKLLRQPGVYDQLGEKASALAEGLKESARRTGVPTCHTRVGSMLCTFFTDAEVRDADSARKSDARRYAAYFHAMLERGVNFAPSQFEAAFLSTAHTEEDIEETIEASYEAMREL
ncbi:MAG: glutamate-1-semialdehyde 2,1-aminomutase [bacterium]